MKRTYVFLLAAVMLIMASCEMVVDVEIPEQESVLVVNGFISPNEPFILFNVRASVPIFSETQSDIVGMYQQLADAEVWLSNGADSVLLPFDPGNFTFSIPTNEFPIEAGLTYRVHVSAPGFKDVYAFTQVPSQPAQFSELYIENLRPVSGDFESSWFVDFRAKWQDDPANDNYYIFQLSQVQFGMQDYYFTDEDRNGSLLSERLEYNTSGFYQATDSLFGVYILNVSEEMFRYKKSMENIVYGDPFSEPTIIYSNVTNGLGCFGSYYGEYRDIAIE